MADDTVELGHYLLRGEEYAGTLTLDGKNSRLVISSNKDLCLTSEDTKEIRGVSSKGERITAIQCVGPPSSNSSMYHGLTRFSLPLFPHHVARGPRYLSADQPEIKAISFTFQGAMSIFYDHGTFGQIWKISSLPFGFKRKILSAVRRAPRGRRRGGRLDLYYHWGRGPIVEVVNSDLRIVASNASVAHSPSPAGIRVDNSARVSVEFASPVKLDEALRTIYDLKPFFELVGQSKENITGVYVTHNDAVAHEGDISLYISFENEGSQREKEKLRPHDVLVSAGYQPAEFEKTLNGWLNLHRERRSARRQFNDGFREGGSYGVARLISIANAFDTLPSGMFERECIPPELVSVKNKLQEQIRKDLSGEIYAEYRHQMLGALGRVGATTLQSKILQRY